MLFGSMDILTKKKITNLSHVGSKLSKTQGASHHPSSSSSILATAEADAEAQFRLTDTLVQAAFFNPSSSSRSLQKEPRIRTFWCPRPDPTRPLAIY
jgi:hypothetical protein